MLHTLREWVSDSKREALFAPFLVREALEINRARLNHLASLHFDFTGKTVLEVGAGIRLHTGFFEERGATVLSTGARPENIAEMRRRYPHRKTRVLDLDASPDISHLGMFDVVYCYGTLYHLAKPEQALNALAGVCRSMILLETLVTPGDEASVEFIPRTASAANQSVAGMGGRPTRRWIMDKLKEYFGCAYQTRTQPCHADFPLDWSDVSAGKNHRAVFVGSKMPLDNPLLSETLVDQQCYDLEHEPQVWIDVGAHLGQHTFADARNKPWITVYAFEPNLCVAAKRFGEIPNYKILPMAVSTQDGFVSFYLNADDATSSLLPFNAEELGQWIGGESLRIQDSVMVPTVRLDTFMNQAQIAHVDYLKIDAQGADFNVIQSAGERIKDIQKIMLEVAITPTQLYEGGSDKQQIIDYLTGRGFSLEAAHRQSHNQEENLIFVRAAS